MKFSLKRPRRRTIKWLATSLTAAIVIIWVSSAWWRATLFDSSHHMLWIYGGRLCFLSADENTIRVVDAGPWTSFGNFGLGWWFYFQHRTDPENASITLLAIPLWTFALFSGLPTGWLWWSDWRRSRPDLCPKSGYDLRGAPHTVCPECGTALNATATT